MIVSDGEYKNLIEWLEEDAAKCDHCCKRLPFGEGILLLKYDESGYFPTPVFRICHKCVSDLTDWIFRA